jgi:hypothetical protein
VRGNDLGFECCGELVDFVPTVVGWIGPCQHDMSYVRPKHDLLLQATLLLQAGPARAWWTLCQSRTKKLSFRLGHCVLGCIDIYSDNKPPCMFCSWSLGNGQWGQLPHVDLGEFYRNDSHKNGLRAEAFSG